MKQLDQLIQKYEKIGITGHVNPDGDCVGSCLGLYNYIKAQYPEKTVNVHLEPIAPVFRFLNGSDRILSDTDSETRYDLFFVLDAGDEKRIGDQAKYYRNAGYRFCFDHHVSNQGFGDEYVIVPEASSTCEILFEAMEYDKIDQKTAEALYMGIVHDTGVFRHSCTSPRTMEIAGQLMQKGVDFTGIITDTFMKKTYLQNQVLGRALLESIMLLDNTCIASTISMSEMEFYGVGRKDLDGIVDQLKLTEGIICAIFLYQTAELEYKVSLRTEEPIDAAAITMQFGGGGHKRAAGCTMRGTKHDILNNIVKEIVKQQNAE